MGQKLCRISRVSNALAEKKRTDSPRKACRYRGVYRTVVVLLRRTPRQCCSGCGSRRAPSRCARIQPAEGQKPATVLSREMRLSRRRAPSTRSRGRRAGRKKSPERRRRSRANKNARCGKSPTSMDSEACSCLIAIEKSVFLSCTKFMQLSIRQTDVVRE
jgi:hypothetical protein